jgi:hypothetical protein
MPLNTEFKDLNYILKEWFLEGTKCSYVFWSGLILCAGVLLSCILSLNSPNSEKLRKLLRVRQKIKDRARISVQFDSRVSMAYRLSMCTTTFNVVGGRQ